MSVTKLSASLTIITLEGIISAGKSTLLEKLKLHSKYKNLLHVLPEPVECWKDVRNNITNGNKTNNEMTKQKDNFNILQCMYQDSKRWGYTMQVKLMVIPCPVFTINIL